MEKDARNRREGGKRRGERRTREDGGNLSVTRRASGNERTPGNVYVLHKEGPPCVPLRSRARARALVPLACLTAPCRTTSRRATSSPLRPPPYVSNPSRTYDATRPMYNASQKSCVACLPACLHACVRCLPACIVCLPACLPLAYLPHRLAFAALLCSALLACAEAASLERIALCWNT